MKGKEAFSTIEVLSSLLISSILLFLFNNFVKDTKLTQAFLKKKTVSINELFYADMNFRNEIMKIDFPPYTKKLSYKILKGKIILEDEYHNFYKIIFDERINLKSLELIYSKRKSPLAIKLIYNLSFENNDFTCIQTFSNYTYGEKLIV